MMTKRELEEGMTKNILESLDFSKQPELIWKTYTDKESSLYKIFEREDGLRLRYKEQSFHLVSPTVYDRFEYVFEKQIITELLIFQAYLIDLEKKKEEEKKARVKIK